ncbi:MAG: DNA adenine methylase [Gammaproteobacteria bacterium]|nr:DNA adenine methylase [Gammaproteobacteria bacterium]
MTEKQIKPPITYFGNKARLATWICSYFPEHLTYFEPFGGSASVLLAKRPSKIEVYNDLNRELVNLFQVLRSNDDLKKLQAALDFTLYSREDFNTAKVPTDTDPIEMARRTLIKYRQSHAGEAKQWSYCITDSVSGMAGSVRKWKSGLERLRDIHKRLQRVQIECLDWAEVIKRYDTEKTLFYIDPPYVHETRVNGTYSHELDDSAHRKLIDSILNVQGMCIISGYEHPIYQALTEAGWTREKKEVIASASSTRAKRIECLWISPGTRKRKNTGVLKSRSNQNDLFSSPVEMMRQGAYYAHALKTKNMTTLILAEINQFKRLGYKVSKTAIDESLNISRENISRRYGHLFL